MNEAEMISKGEKVDPTDPIAKAVADIGIIMDQCAVMGNNEAEIPNLMKLISQVQSGEKEPEVAVEEARSIYSSKSQYR